MLPSVLSLLPFSKLSHVFSITPTLHVVKGRLRVGEYDTV